MPTISGEIRAFENFVNFAEATKERITLLRSGIALLFLVIAAISWAGYRMLQDFRASSESLMNAYELREKLESTLAVVGDLETSTRDFLLTRAPESYDGVCQSSALLHEHLNQLRGLARLDVSQGANVDYLEELSHGLIVAARKTVAARERGLNSAMRTFRNENVRCLADEIGLLMDEMKRHEKQLLNDRQDAASRRVRWNAASCGLVLAADVAVLGWIAALSLRLSRLHRVIRVCAWTKQVEHNGKWITLEEYLQAMLDAPVTHGICAEAAADLVAASTSDLEATESISKR